MKKRMSPRRKKIRLLALLLLGVLFLFSGQTAVGEEYNSVEEALEQEVEEQFSALDTELFEEFLAQLDENTRSLYGGLTLEELVGEVLAGQAGNAEEFFDQIFQLLLSRLLAFLPSLISVIMIALLGGLLNGMRARFLGKNTGEIVHFVCYLSIVLIVISVLIPLMNLAGNTVQTLRDLMNLLFPLILTLMTASGGVMSGNLFQPLSAVLSNGVSAVVASVVLPVFMAVTVLSVISNLSENISLEKLIDFFKSAGLWLNGICFTVFFAFLSVQGITAAGYDGISIRAAKYAIGNSIPIVGGYLKEGFDLILGSCVLLKNAIGVCGLLIILSIVILPLLQILLFSLGLKLTAGICEPLADKKIPAFLTMVSKNLSLLIAAVLGVAFMFFITVMLFILSSNAVLA